jgi:hypothetical protein
MGFLEGLPAAGAPAARRTPPPLLVVVVDIVTRSDILIN